MGRLGYVDLPQKVKKQLGFKPDDRLLAVRINESILLKKMEYPDIEKEFEALASETATRFREKDVAREDVDEAVRWSRE